MNAHMRALLRAELVERLHQEALGAADGLIDQANRLDLMAKRLEAEAHDARCRAQDLWDRLVRPRAAEAQALWVAAEAAGEAVGHD